MEDMMACPQRGTFICCLSPGWKLHAQTLSIYYLRCGSTREAADHCCGAFRSMLKKTTREVTIVTFKL